MIRKISYLVLASFFFSSCGFKTPLHDARNIYRQLERQSRAQTPPDYYGQAKPASFSPLGSEGVKGFSGTESDNRGHEGPSDKSHYIIIGTLAGLALVAGIVIPIVLLKK